MSMSIQLKQFLKAFMWQKTEVSRKEGVGVQGKAIGSTEPSTFTSLLCTEAWI